MPFPTVFAERKGKEEIIKILYMYVALLHASAENLSVGKRQRHAFNEKLVKKKHEALALKHTNQRIPVNHYNFIVA